jgi:hypothetical protein
VRSTEKLVHALREAGAPADLITRAEANEFHDYKSQSATPCLDLNRALTTVIQSTPETAYTYAFLTKMRALRSKAQNGEFDATKEESDEWAASPEGIAVLGEIIKPFNKDTDS